VTAAARLLDAALLRIVNPLVSIELAASFRRKRFLAAFSITLLVVVAILLMVLVASLDSAMLYPSRVGQNIFLAFTITLVVAMFLLFPAFASVSIVEERVNRSLDLLLTTRMAPWEIFYGKWVATLVYSVTYLAGTMPVVGLAFLLGGVDVEALVALGALALALAAVITSIGTFASSATSSLLRAVIASYFLSFLFGAALVGASIPVVIRHVALSTGQLDARMLSEIESLFELYGDLVYAGTALLFVSVGGFFAIVGTNRLAPPSHDRSTPVRAFLAAVLVAAALLDITLIERELSVATEQEAFAWLAVSVGRPAGVLFLITLVFSTELRVISRRVVGELARRRRLSPLRLLAPGTTRGALYSIALSAALILGVAAYGSYVRGFGRAGTELIFGRGDLVVPDLALLLFSFLAFTASLGRVLALRARGVVGPRVLVVALAVLLCAGPLLVFAVNQGVSWRNRGEEEAAPRFPAPSISSAYVLSPLLAGGSVFEVSSRAEWAGAFYIFPEHMPYAARHAAEQWRYSTIAGATSGKTPAYSETWVATFERRAIPLHRATTWLYGALAALLWLAGSRIERGLQRAEGAAS